MIELFLAGNVLEAGKIQLELLPLIRSMGQNGRTNPVCLIKGAMAMVGYPTCFPRLPLTPGTPEEMSIVRKRMEALGIV
jgi:4-hydroxy-tetrahydrodipicolinate synthase